MSVSSPTLPPKIPTLCVANSISSNTSYSLLFISLVLNIILILILISFVRYHRFANIKHNDTTVSRHVDTSFYPNPPPREIVCCEQINGEMVQDKQEKVSSTKTFEEYVEPWLGNLIIYDDEIGETTDMKTLPAPEFSGQTNGKLVEDTEEAVVSSETISLTMRLNESIEPSMLDLVVYDNEILKTSKTAASTATAEAKTTTIKIASKNHTKDIKSMKGSTGIRNIKEMEEALHDENEGENDLDSMWKIIMEGGGETRKLRKCETSDVPPRVDQKAETKTDLHETWENKVRKPESFDDSVFRRRRGGLRRGESLTRDEVKLASEAFIKNFWCSIRLQKQESLLRTKIRA